MNFGQMKTEVKNWVNRSDLDAQIPTFIRLAMLNLQREFTFKVMERTFTKTLANGDALFALPSTTGSSAAPPTEYKAPHQMRILDGDDLIVKMMYLPKEAFDRLLLATDTSVMEPFEPGNILVRDNLTGIPLAYSEWNNQIHLFPAVSEDGVNKTLELDYYAIADYTGVADTFEDWFLVHGWDVILYRSLLEAEPYLGFDREDSRVSIWRTRYKEASLKLYTMSLGKDFSESTKQGVRV